MPLPLPLPLQLSPGPQPRPRPRPRPPAPAPAHAPAPAPAPCRCHCPALLPLPLPLPYMLAVPAQEHMGCHEVEMYCMESHISNKLLEGVEFDHPPAASLKAAVVPARNAALIGFGTIVEEGATQGAGEPRYTFDAEEVRLRLEPRRRQRTVALRS